MERIPSGIEGLDTLIEGGFPRSRSVLVSGGPGTGKTTFGLQFLAHGAKNGEPGVAVSFEENPIEWREDMLNFGVNLDVLEFKKKLAIIDASLAKLGLESNENRILTPHEYDMQHILVSIINTAKEIGAKRILIDNISALDIMSENACNIRRNVLMINYLMKANSMTALLLSETDNGHDASTYGVGAYIVDGLVSLHYDAMKEDERYLMIHKMRGTKHSARIHPFDFVKDKGIVVRKERE